MLINLFSTCLVTFVKLFNIRLGYYTPLEIEIFKKNKNCLVMLILRAELINNYKNYNLFFSFYNINDKNIYKFMN